MARVFTEGFEFGDRGWVKTTSGDGSLAGSGFSVLASHARGGQYAMGIQIPTGANPGRAMGVITLPNRLTEAHFRYPIWLSSLQHMASARDPLAIFGSNGINQCGISLDRDSGKVGFCVTGYGWTSPSSWSALTLNASSNQSIPVGSEIIEGGYAWALIEIHIKLTGTGLIEVKLGGIPVLSYTGNMKATAGQPDGFDTIQIVSPSLNAGGAFFVDDLAVNDTTGAVDNSWPGGGSVMALWPNAPGDVSEWTGSDGDAIDNWALVRPGSEGYAQTNTPGAKDLYRLDEAAISNLSTITGVWVEGRGKDLAGDADPIKLLVRDAAGNESVSPNIPMPATVASIIGPRMVEPPAGGSWKLSDLVDLQVGIQNGD